MTIITLMIQVDHPPTRRQRVQLYDTKKANCRARIICKEVFACQNDGAVVKRFYLRLPNRMSHNHNTDLVIKDICTDNGKR